MRSRGWYAVRLGLAAGLTIIGGAAGPQEPKPLISVDVNLVVLQASVHDRRGRDVPDLEQSNFALFEDGVRQDIRLFRREDTPVNLCLVIDHSGSMEAKMKDVVAAARIFATLSNRADDLSVINFNDGVFPPLTVQENGTSRPTQVEAAISNRAVEGRTALYDAVAAGLGQLARGRREKKVMLVISDGGDNASTRTLADVIRMAESSSAVIYTAGIFTEYDRDANPAVLRRLARETGGEAFFPRRISDIEDICAHIAHDIRSQYMVGYVSNNMDGETRYRSIRLAAQAPDRGKLTVRTRAGYIPQIGGEGE